LLRGWRIALASPPDRRGGFRAPTIIRWPGKVPAGKVENGIISGLDWFPTFVAAAGNPNIVEEL
jgi:arylsulfatase